MARFKASLFLIVILLASFLLANSALEPVAAEPAADGYVFSHSWGAEGDQIRSPGGVAIASDGTVYIANTGLNRITKIPAGRRTFLNWGEPGSGEGQFNSPGGIALDNNGNVYVADTDNNRIQKFSPDGKWHTWGWGVQDSTEVFQTCTSGCQAGIYGGGDGQFDSPGGIAVDGAGNVYVADSRNNRIQKFSSSGVPLDQWGRAGSGEGQFSSPSGIAVDGAGNVYVADKYNNRIQKFSPDGKWHTWGWGVQDSTEVFQTCTSGCQAGIYGGGDGQFGSPGGIAVGADDNVYVADKYNERIQKFSPDGDFLQTWGWGVQDGTEEFQTCTSGCQLGIYGGGAGQFAIPEGIAVTAAGNVYVADTDNHRIQKLSSSGLYERQWGSLVSDAGQFNNPFDIDDDAAGNVYVADTFNHRIQKFSRSGANLAQWGGFSYPEGIAVTAAGNVYVADTDNHRIQKFSRDGKFERTWGWGVQDGAEAFQTCTSGCQDGIKGDGDGQFDSPLGIAVDGAGNVYVIEGYVLEEDFGVFIPGNNRIQKFSHDGDFLQTWGWGVQDGTEVFQTCTSGCQAGIEGDGDGQFDQPFDIAVGANGDVYVADSGNDRIQKFSRSGKFERTWGWGVQDGTEMFQTCTSGCQAGIYGGGDGDGQFDYPRSVDAGADGNVYVADTRNDRIQKFNSSGAYLTQWGSEGNAAGQFTYPVGIAVGADGKVYVADSFNDRIQVFRSTYPTPDPISGIVFNGSFESGPSLPGWAYGGSLPVKRGTRAVLGFYGLQLGEPVPQSPRGLSEAGAHQTFRVPDTWSRPMLTFRYNMFVNQSIHFSDFFVAIQDGVGLNHKAAVLRDGYQPCPLPDGRPAKWPPEGTDLGWRINNYDLSEFKGQHIRLVFANRNLHPNSLGIWTHVDDVRVVDAGPAPPPPPVGAEKVYLPVFAGIGMCDPVPGSASNQQSNSVSLLQPAASDALQKRE